MANRNQYIGGVLGQRKQEKIYKVGTIWGRRGGSLCIVLQVHDVYDLGSHEIQLE